MWRFKSVIPIILVMLLLIYMYRRSHRHEFWDRQWVSRNHSKKGVLNHGRPPKSVYESSITKNNKKYSLTTFNCIDDMDEAIHFLNQHFLKNYLNTPELLHWLLNPEPVGNLVLKDQKNWIATISTRNMLCRIDKTIYPLGYVDFLAVHEKYRNQGLATRMIGGTLEKYPLTSFVFKKEDTPLPFDYFCEFQYFSKPILRRNKLDYRWIENPDPKLSYQLYQKTADRFAISESFSLYQWKKHIHQPKLVYSYTLPSKSNIGKYSNLISFFTYNMNIHGRVFKMAEILYICCDHPKQTIHTCIEACEFYASQQGCQILVFTNLGDLEPASRIEGVIPSKKT